jgi:uncharacterized membrane protein YbhN (UPF0104 family)
MFLFYFYARALSWNLILKSLGSHFKIKDSLFAWFAGESTRYVPGNVWSFASRFFLSVTHGVPKTNVILSILLEIILMLPVTLLLSVPALWINYGKVHFSVLTVLVVIGVLALATGILFFSKRAKQALKELRHVPRKIFFTNTFLGALLLQILAWSAFGLGNYFLIQPFAQHVSAGLVVSISILAWFLGYISIVTPMGLGVREGALILLLGSGIGQGQAGLAAVLSRVVLTSTEGINLLYWLYIYQGKKNKTLLSPHVK